jgi:hypothetical protein
MRLDSHSARTIQYCKLKRVYPRPPLRVHSPVAKGLKRQGSGNLFRSKTPASDAARSCESCPDRLRIRLNSELSSQAWGRPQSVACWRKGSAKGFLPGPLGEAS